MVPRVSASDFNSVLLSYHVRMHTTRMLFLFLSLLFVFCKITHSLSPSLSLYRSTFLYRCISREFIVSKHTYLLLLSQPLSIRYLFFHLTTHQHFSQCCWLFVSLYVVLSIGLKHVLFYSQIESFWGSQLVLQKKNFLLASTLAKVRNQV